MEDKLNWRTIHILCWQFEFFGRTKSLEAMKDLVDNPIIVHILTS